MAEQRQVPGVKTPRVAITYCTQCKWMLRAAYFGQELLSTFGTSIGEIALIPATGGVFTVYLNYSPSSTEANENPPTSQVLIWDRKTDGGFPEAKILKQRIRNHIEPEKNLGHSDTPSSKAKSSTSLEGDIVAKESSPAGGAPTASSAPDEKESEKCEDCA